MPTFAFQNRETEMAQVCAKADQPTLLNIYGEVGIGKSRLLNESAERLRAESPPAMVLEVDLDLLSGVMPSGRPERVLGILIEQARNWLSGRSGDAELVAGQIVAQLGSLARRMPAVLIFDSTEVLQEDMDFWRWMEEFLIGPLIIEERIRQIFAGRVPVPWRRPEIRRAVKLLPLAPLSLQDAARNLTREILEQQNPSLQDDESVEQAIGLVLEFSFGHPLLSEKLSAYVAPYWPATALGAFRTELCQGVVKTFVEQNLFRGIKPPWKEILWLASVLDWFDPTVLQRYLGRAAPVLAEGRPDYFFVQGISQLRIGNTVVWRAERGDRLHGVIGDIVRHCFEVMDPQAYRKACLAAAETFQALAGEFPEGDEDAQRHYQEAETYRRRAEEEKE